MAKLSQSNGKGAALPDVLTLAEAATYLRTNVTDVLRLIDDGELPARRVEGDYRLLKQAIADWLSKRPSHHIPPGTPEAILPLAGLLHGEDPDEFLATIRSQRMGEK